MAALFLHLAIEAVGPLVRSWEVRDIDQEGQLTIYNNIPDGGQYGMPVAIGDWDGDGNKDLAVAPMKAASGPAESPRSEAGVLYVYKGEARLAGVVDADGETPPALTLWGARAGDMLGTEVFSADINGDGVEDLIIGAQNHDGPDGDCINCGAAYVLFGRADLFGEANRLIDTAEPAADLMTIYGGVPGGRLGIWVEAGDLDADGRDDLIIGADQTPADEASRATLHRGMVVVVYGRRTFPDSIRLDQAQAGDLPGLSRIVGRDGEDHFGSSIHCVDLNGDGFDELIVGSALLRRSAAQGEQGAFEAHNNVGGDGPDGGRLDAGEATIVFSRSDGARLPPLLDLREPPPEFVKRITYIYGSHISEVCAEEIASGDFNGDGISDLVLGAIRAKNPFGRQLAGKAYVLYWRPGLEGVEIDLRLSGEGIVPPGVEVSVMYGLADVDLLGDTLTAGDFNHDGIDDLAVGIPHSAVGETREAGMVAIVYGRRWPWPDLWAPQAEGLAPALQVTYILGADEGDLLAYSMDARDYDNDGYADLFSNAMQGAGNGNTHEKAGEAYVLSGYRFSGTGLHVERASPATGHVSSSTKVQLTGRGFTMDVDMAVKVNDRTLENFKVVDGRRLDVTLPPAADAGPVDITVSTRYGSSTLAAGFQYLTDEQFIRGDADLDLLLTITDSMVILGSLFQGKPLRCLDAGDSDDGGSVNLGDVMYVLDYLFQGGPPPPPPFADSGTDATDDALGCEG